AIRHPKPSFSASSISAARISQPARCLNSVVLYSWNAPAAVAILFSRSFGVRASKDRRGRPVAGFTDSIVIDNLSGCIMTRLLPPDELWTRAADDRFRDRANEFAATNARSVPPHTAVDDVIY